jgi:hypothetical protein
MPNKIPPKQTCDQKKRKQMWKGGKVGGLLVQKVGMLGKLQGGVAAIELR